MPTRRDVLAGLGAAAVGAASVSTATARHAPDDEYAAAHPSHVQLDFPRSLMERYRPALDLSATDRTRFYGLWGWRARSPEYDYDWYVYWAEWSHQTGVSEYDSHNGDHEPFYVAVDPNTGDVGRVDFSAYHWLHGQAVAPGIPITDGTHPTAVVNAPYHHYTSTPAPNPILPDVEDLADVFEAWLANGLDGGENPEDGLQPGTVHDPATMRYRGYWWRDNVGGFSTTAFYVSLARKVGFHREGGIADWWPLALRAWEVRWVRSLAAAGWTPPARAQVPPPTTLLEQLEVAR
jgi:hypothetical protein